MRSLQNQSLRQRSVAPDHKPRRLGVVKPLLVVIVVLALAVFAGYHYSAVKSTKSDRTIKSVATASTMSVPVIKTNTTSSTPTVAAIASATSACTGNTVSQLVLVSISQRHLWACDGTTVAYDSPVITGMENLAADLTPVGTYHVYAKETNITLRGSDSTGSWNDPVAYWMPFLDNQYGAYGFHDATWRADSAFGNTSPYSSDASHGCVECPLATAKWLYGWVSIGTTVTIEA